MENYKSGEKQVLTEALGQSEIFLDFQQRLSRVASVNRPVLIIGERGTGKELAALRLHYLSKRWNRPLVTLNCAALTSSLIETELFGHEKGAFTGATERRRGRFETANGGTLFLDEIGNIPMEAQEKILRVVEYGTFERVGSTRNIEADVRIVAATNVDLRTMAKEGKFKSDLLDRLSFDVLFVPPLRYRGDDILLLAGHFAARMAHELGRSDLPELSDAVEKKLLEYPWTGNVRELKNVIERAVYRAESSVIEEIDFDPFRYPFGCLEGDERKRRAEPEPGEAGPVEPRLVEESDSVSPGEEKEIVPFEDAVKDFQLSLLKQGLERARFNQKKAAEIMGLSYHQFRGLYRKFQGDLE